MSGTNEWTNDSPRREDGVIWLSHMNARGAAALRRGLGWLAPHGRGDLDVERALFARASTLTLALSRLRERGLKRGRENESRDDVHA